MKHAIHNDLINKKSISGCILIAIIGIYFSCQNVSDICYIFVRHTAPILTYDMECGSGSIAYEGSYTVMQNRQDKKEEPQNSDLAVDEHREEENVNESSTVETSAHVNNMSIGTIYTRKQLSNPDFLKSKIFTIDGNTSMTADELNIANLVDADMSLDDLLNATSDGNQGYKVLIYHTHASEAFVDSRPGVIEDTVVGAGDYLAKLLNEQYGIPTYHDRTTYDVIDGRLDRSKAYEYAYKGITKILKDNPSIEVVIDLHRDGVDEETHLVTEINGKPTAKIMFLNGVSRSEMNGDIEYLANPNKLGNLAFSFQLYLAGKENYGDFVRKIYVRSLRYNLHVMPRATLIEAGAQNNTLQEELNAMEPLASMLDKVLRKQE
ncbi:MAG: stage II sporulation protein P [Lachnospiraceae bacterium]|nr:stage II sporulation protein P [Lachnospiraceae bacterium]